jgi:hypothetical protein
LLHVAGWLLAAANVCAYLFVGRALVETHPWNPRPPNSTLLKQACLGEKLAMQSKNVKNSFRKLDADYSGALDKDEFRAFLVNLNLQVTTCTRTGLAQREGNMVSCLGNTWRVTWP